jgi:multidrug efflux pump subunit AcrA (membrane-fusion protein)
MYVRALLGQGVDEQALLLPQLAVARDARGQPVAMVVGADHKVVARSVQVEDAGANRWRVLSGLSPGERVVVQGLQDIHEGGEVQDQVVDLAANTAPR